jgi:hypothetical protein
MNIGYLTTIISENNQIIKSNGTTGQNCMSSSIVFFLYKGWQECLDVGSME